MKTGLKLILVLILLFLLASCGNKSVTISPATTIPSTMTVTQPTAIISTPLGTLSASPTPISKLTPSPVPIATPSIITFDFDTGSPTNLVGKNTPIEQTSGGVTAYFSSPSDPAAYSIQNQNTTFFTLTQFSGNYLYPNKQFRTSLIMKFSQLVTSITLTFATTDSHGPGNVEQPTNINLTAYLNSTGATPVTSVRARGTFSNDTFPQGIISSNSGGQPFNLVVVELSVQPQAGTTFIVDNITVVIA